MHIFGVVLKKIIPENSFLIIRQLYNYKFKKKEIEITHKYCIEQNTKIKKEKITVVFLIWMESMWNSLRSVYEEALNNPFFNVYIVAQPHITDRQNKKEKNSAYEFLNKEYENVINAIENDTWFDLRTLSPDYVFYTYPYSSYYYKDYNPVEVRKYSKICLINYGFDTSRDSLFYISYNWNFCKNAAIIFATCKSAKARLHKVLGNSYNCYPKIVYKGFPRFDLINREKTNSKRLCICWTPRWTVKSKQKYDIGSSFLLYYDNFLNYATIHKDIDFIIRPHPLMFSNFLKEKVITQDELDTFKIRCQSLNNLVIDESADYLKTINATDIFVTDYTSLMLEYFATGRPIVFLAKAHGFAKEAKLMDKTIYHAFTWNELECILEDLINGNDKMRELRLAALTDLFPSEFESSASSILNYLRTDYYGDYLI